MRLRLRMDLQRTTDHKQRTTHKLTASDVRKKLQEQADPEIAKHSGRFFKTGPGEYGEGDRFLGLRVPWQRKIAKTYKNLPLPEVRKLLHSAWHEERLTALLILTYQFPKTDETGQKEIYDFYMANTRQINNWDLVDSSAEHIAGAYLLNRKRDILRELAQSGLIWERRIAIMSTFHFIKKGEFGDTLEIADLLLDDEHDLIHKAAGWMLREAGKRNLPLLENFLKPRYKTMPRTMLRYAIEKFPEEKRQKYLKGEI